MQQLKERMAYLKGLAEGLNVGVGTSEGRLMLAMMDVMNEIVRSLDRLQSSQDQLETYVEAVDDDLTDLENAIYDDYDSGLEFDLEDEYGDEYDEDLELDGLDDTAIEYLEMVCPNCGETVFVDEDVFENDEVIEVLCPECKETVLVNDPQAGLDVDDEDL